MFQIFGWQVLDIGRQPATTTQSLWIVVIFQWRKNPNFSRRGSLSFHTLIGQMKTMFNYAFGYVIITGWCVPLGIRTYEHSPYANNWTVTSNVHASFGALYIVWMKSSLRVVVVGTVKEGKASTNNGTDLTHGCYTSRLGSQRSFL